LSRFLESVLFLVGKILELSEQANKQVKNILDSDEIEIEIQEKTKENNETLQLKQNSKNDDKNENNGDCC
jgi:hypothetical protein